MSCMTNTYLWRWKTENKAGAAAVCRPQNRHEDCRHQQQASISKRRKYHEIQRQIIDVNINRMNENDIKDISGASAIMAAAKK